jgi:hypothetical protein
VRARFGDEVHERLVDPLVGSIYAADTDHFSLTAVPQIADLATRHAACCSRRVATGKPAPSDGPVFYAPAARSRRDGRRGGGADVVSELGGRVLDIRQPCADPRHAVPPGRTGGASTAERFDAVRSSPARPTQ